MSTIAAIATGPAAGGIGIIRLSGPASLTAARRVAKALPAAPVARHGYFTRFTDSAGAMLDEGLLLYFAAPHSMTGEDVVELHAHGAPRLLSLLLGEVLREDGVRLATAGEFTRRAFLAGRIDLARAEAVADLVAAESEAQVRAAAAQLSGELTARIQAVHGPLLALQADLEGSLDFPEETEGAEVDVAPRLAAGLAAVRRLLADARRGALIRRGARVVLYGPVNAGKSTLFNALSGAARALVDAEPGTTRDTLEARLELSGLAITLVDTAGLREDAGRIEALGIGRTREALAGADLCVLVLPPEATAVERAAWRNEADAARLLEVQGKSDLLRSSGAESSDAQDALGGADRSSRAESSDAHDTLGDADRSSRAKSREQGSGVSPAPLDSARDERGPAARSVNPDQHHGGLPGVSGQTGAGLPELRARISARLGAGGASAVLATSERHLATLEQVETALVRATEALSVSTLEVVAGELGLALHSFAELTGQDASTALLDAIFQRFCIGK